MTITQTKTPAPGSGGSQALHLGRAQDHTTQLAALAAMASSDGFPLLPVLGMEPGEHQPGMAVRAWRFTRTCTRAAKLLPTVRQAVPWYVWPILGLAAAVKCLPVDFGADETLFAIAFALIAWKRPGLLKALYREAQAGKPVRCGCARHAEAAR